LYSSKYIVLVIKAVRMAGVVRHACGSLVGKSEWRISLRGRWCRWEDNIKNKY
jgi:hypothetical protein